MWYNPNNIVLLEVMPKRTDNELIRQRLEELDQLVQTYWWLTVVEVVQQKIKPDYGTYVWSGKLEEIIIMMESMNAWTLVIGNILKSKQLYNINEILRPHWLQARDRVDLILKIFDRHASSTEARLQIEMAAIKHMWPRIYGMGMELSRQWGWIWTSGIWETNTEIMRRHLATRKKQIEKELKQYESVRSVHRESRLRKNLPTVGLVWYTNAWKSTVMNSLTNKWVLVEDKLFATLWTDVGQLYFPSSSWKWTTVLINDTIWFIRDLPPSLIQAFMSTLEDSVEANLLFHINDASDPLVEDKIQVVDEILAQIWAEQPRVLVFNKIDMFDNPEEKKKELLLLAEKYAYTSVTFVSAWTWEWMEWLIDMMRDHYWIEKFDW